MRPTDRERGHDGAMVYQAVALEAFEDRDGLAEVSRNVYEWYTEHRTLDATARDVKAWAEERLEI